MTGLQEIDNDHRRISEAIDEIGGRCREHDTEQVIESLSDLEKLSREHFSREEELMRAVGYAGIFEHGKQHYLLLQFLHNLIEMVRSDSLRCDGAIIQILREWQDTHTHSADVELLPLFSSTSSTR